MKSSSRCRHLLRPVQSLLKGTLWGVEKAEGLGSEDRTFSLSAAAYSCNFRIVSEFGLVMGRMPFHFPALEKEMATHSSVLAWRIPGTGEPGGLPSMVSHRIRHNWSDLAAATFCSWVSDLRWDLPLIHRFLKIESNTMIAKVYLNLAISIF